MASPSDTQANKTAAQTPSYTVQAFPGRPPAVPGPQLPLWKKLPSLKKTLLSCGAIACVLLLCSTIYKAERCDNSVGTVASELNISFNYRSVHAEDKNIIRAIINSDIECLNKIDTHFTEFPDIFTKTTGISARINATTSQLAEIDNLFDNVQEVSLLRNDKLLQEGPMLYVQAARSIIDTTPTTFEVFWPNPPQCSVRIKWPVSLFTNAAPRLARSFHRTLFEPVHVRGAHDIETNNLEMLIKDARYQVRDMTEQIEWNQDELAGECGFYARSHPNFCLLARAEHAEYLGAAHLITTSVARDLDIVLAYLSLEDHGLFSRLPHANSVKILAGDLESTPTKVAAAIIDHLSLWLHLFPTQHRAQHNLAASVKLPAHSIKRLAVVHDLEVTFQSLNAAERMPEWHLDSHLCPN